MSIEIKNLRICFDNKVVFEDFSYSFPERGIVALIGKSGSGKTTLLRVIAGLQAIHGGTVTLPDSVSFSFQEYRLLKNLSVLDNLLLVSFDKVNKDTTECALKMLKRLSLAQNQNDFPSTLSGGTKQRVSLCRAFLSNAPVLLLDEPLKELDPALRDEVMRIIKEEGERRLVVLSLHDEEIAHTLDAEIVTIS